MTTGSSETSPKEFLDVAIETALEAGRILREEYALPPDIRYKGDVDLVTQADRRSEQAIVARLSRYFPSHTIAAEEGTGHERSSEFRWHVDPLDGTTNFAHKYPCFAVSIALAQNDTVIAGVVYNPISEELFAAAHREGSTLNGKKIAVSKIDTLSTSLLCTGFPVHKRLANPNIHYYYDFTLRSHGVRRDGSAALDLASVACGRFDGFWEFGLKPWDTAAGILLVHEAGGTVSEFNGEPYRLGGPMVLATNGKIHQEMRETALLISERDPNSPLQPPGRLSKV
jgi:myo-inositol-1(or 4)-monophosphatase